MQDYEIRILGPEKEHGRRNHTLIEVMHLNDSTAIRAARSLAAGRPFEVWRGIERIDFEERIKPHKPAHGSAA
ncbi:MAG TPA: hypothetical protein VH189_11145 [Rhizomicrobium sp.]|nr:hypothetical protein [Rhizomicrobium sp.]